MSLSHQPCADCGSRDALIINDDGSTKCFSCGAYHSNDNSTNAKANSVPTDFIKGVSRDLKDRCITKSTCSRYKYNVADYKGKEVQVATYRDLDGNPVFQKIRFTDEKSFITIGKFKPLLYGMHNFKGNNKKIIITEGID